MPYPVSQCMASVPDSTHSIEVSWGPHYFILVIGTIRPRLLSGQFELLSLLFLHCCSHLVCHYMYCLFTDDGSAYLFTIFFDEMNGKAACRKVLKTVYNTTQLCISNISTLNSCYKYLWVCFKDVNETKFIAFLSYHMTTLTENCLLNLLNYLNFSSYSILSLKTFLKLELNIWSHINFYLFYSLLFWGHYGQYVELF